MGFLQADPEAWFQGGADAALGDKVEALLADPHRGPRRQGLADRRPHPRRADRAQCRGHGQRRRRDLAAKEASVPERSRIQMPIKIEHRVGIPAPPTCIWEISADIPRWPEWTAHLPRGQGRDRVRREADPDAGPAGPEAAGDRAARVRLGAQRGDPLEAAALWRPGAARSAIWRSRPCPRPAASSPTARSSTALRSAGCRRPCAAPMKAGFAALGEAMEQRALALWRERASETT